MSLAFKLETQKENDHVRNHPQKNKTKKKRLVRQVTSYLNEFKTLNVLSALRSDCLLSSRPFSELGLTVLSLNGTVFLSGIGVKTIA